MREDEKRCGASFAISLAVHLVAAALIGFFGYRFVTKQPEILEVTLVGGGAPEEVVEQQEEQSVLRSIDDIIDKKLQPEKKKVVYKKQAQPSATPAPGKPAPNSKPGDGDGSGSGFGSGSGDGQERGVPVTPPRVVSAPQPKYPGAARSAGIEGVVGVRILVSAEGKVEEARVVRSSGNAALDDSALSAVYKWRFSPAKDKFGQKARCYVTQGIRFDLRK